MTVLDRVPLDRITAEARRVRPVRMLLTVLAGLLYAVGWVAARVLGAVWFALVWTGTAVRVGWVEARHPGADGRQ